MIIGITGTFGSGKGTVVDYLVEKKGFKRFAVSDTFLVSEAIKRGMEPDRPARQKIANEYRVIGPTKLQEAVYEMAKGAIEAGDNVVIEPQHTVGEVRFIQSIGGKVIAANADLETRYNRIHARGSAKDNVTFEEFKAFEELEMHSEDPDRNNLAASAKAADFHVTNNGTLDELYVQIDALPIFS